MFMATIREQDPELTRPAGAIAVLLCYGAVADKSKLFNSNTEKGLSLIGLRANNTTLVVSGAAGVWSEMFGCSCVRWACVSSSGSWVGRRRQLWSCAGLALLQQQESWGLLSWPSVKCHPGSCISCTRVSSLDWKAAFFTVSRSECAQLPPTSPCPTLISQLFGFCALILTTFLKNYSLVCCPSFQYMPVAFGPDNLVGKGWSSGIRRVQSVSISCFHHP